MNSASGCDVRMTVALETMRAEITQRPWTLGQEYSATSCPVFFCLLKMFVAHRGPATSWAESANRDHCYWFCSPCPAHERTLIGPFGEGAERVPL